MCEKMTEVLQEMQNKKEEINQGNGKKSKELRMWRSSLRWKRRLLSNIGLLVLTLWKIDH